MDGLDFSKIKFELKAPMSSCMRELSDYGIRQQEIMDSITEANNERRREEEEQRQNIRKIAENSEETVNSLKETNTILKENNELLKEKNEILVSKLDEINNVINLLVNATREESKNQEDVMEQALALAVQLNVATEENSKVNWKELIANTSINTVLLSLQVFLNQRGLL
jgi:predicted RNase H-like nuclease (RuvC/YqgF family)